MNGSESTVPPTRWRRVGDFHLMCTDAGVPVPNELWDEVLAALDDPTLKGCISMVGDDGAPKLDKQQWTRSNTVIRKHGFKTLVMTDHRSTLAMVTASSWLGLEVQARPWAELEQGMAFLEVPIELREAFREAANQLRDRVPPYRP